VSLRNAKETGKRENQLEIQKKATRGGNLCRRSSRNIRVSTGGGEGRSRKELWATRPWQRGGCWGGRKRTDGTLHVKQKEEVKEQMREADWERRQEGKKTHPRRPRTLKREGLCRGRKGGGSVAGKKFGDSCSKRKKGFPTKKRTN